MEAALAAAAAVAAAAPPPTARPPPPPLPPPPVVSLSMPPLPATSQEIHQYANDNMPAFKQLDFSGYNDKTLAALADDFFLRRGYSAIPWQSPPVQQKVQTSVTKIKQLYKTSPAIVVMARRVAKKSIFSCNVNIFLQRANRWCCGDKNQSFYNHSRIFLVSIVRLISDFALFVPARQTNINSCTPRYYVNFESFNFDNESESRVPTNYGCVMWIVIERAM
jgi:hypothetical protein